LQQLAGEATMSYCVVGCCEIEKYSSGSLLSRKPLLDFFKVTWSTVDLPCQKVAYSCESTGSMFGSTRA